MVTKTYHLHSHYCGHSANQLEETILYAIKQGYKEIGFSEHIPLKSNPMRQPSLDDLKKMFKELVALKEKYKDQISIKIGIESEYHENNHQWFEMLYNLPELDYANYANHFFGDPSEKFNWIEKAPLEPMLNEQADNCQKALATGMYSCYVHPDLFLAPYQKWDELAKKTTQIIIDTAIKFDIPLEFNVNGINKKENLENNLLAQEFQFPCIHFWKEVAKTNAKVIIGADAHDYQTLSQQSMARAEKLISQWNLSKNLVTDIKFK